MLDESVLRLGEDFHQRGFVQVFQGRDDRQATDKFWNKTEFQQVFGFNPLQDFACVAVFLDDYVGAEADRRSLPTLGNNFIQARESPTAYE